MKPGPVILAVLLALLAAPAFAAEEDAGSKRVDKPDTHAELSDEDRAVIVQMELLELLELLQDLEAVQAMEEDTQ